jgi:filamentous hemagglutinin family protein
MLRVIGLLGIVSTLMTTIPAIAEVTSDGSTGTVVTPSGAVFNITGGTTVGGRNLFHSFDRFDVPTLGVANFLNAPGIVNIFSRVTGGKISKIDGVLRSQGVANLFLMNPSGIIFERNASLDVKGSFVATTASGIQFGDRGTFSASVSPVANVLTVDPSAFLFGQAPEEIVNRSIAPAGTDLSNSVNLAGLRVQEGKNLLLIGGDINFEGGNAVALGGNIELASIETVGSITLDTNSVPFRLNLPENLARADVKFIKGGGITVAGRGQGNIAIQARNIDVLEGSYIEAGIGPNLVAETTSGNITLNARGALTVKNSFVYSGVFSNASGNSGKIDLSANSLSLSDGGQIYAGIFNSSNGDAGIISIKVKDQIVLGGTSAEGNPSGIFSNLFNGGRGSVSNIEIQTALLLVEDGGEIVLGTRGEGNTGKIIVNASDKVVMRKKKEFTGIVNDVFAGGNGNTQGVEITTGSMLLADGAIILSNVRDGGKGDVGGVRITATGSVTLDGQDQNRISRTEFFPSAIFSNINQGGEGNSNGIVIKASSLSITNRAQVSSTTEGIGNAGDIVIETQDKVFLLNSLINSEVTEGKGVGNGGDINITTGSLIIKDGSALLADTENRGNAGNIIINARESLILEGEGPGALDRDVILPSQISTTVEADAIGRGGSIKITAPSILMTDSAFISSKTVGQGRAGNIDVTTERLRMESGAEFLAPTEGSSDAGNITINARDSITISGMNANRFVSGVFANTEADSTGQGGNITLRANSLSLSDNARISAQSLGSNRAGEIIIQVSNLFNVSNGTIRTSASASSGGAISINAGKVRLQGNSEITSSVANGVNGGGNISIAADYILARDDSNIFAFSRDGQGGNISLSRAFFGIGYQPSSLRSEPDELRGNGRPDINATGRISSGIVTTPDTSFIQNNLTQLSQNAIDTNTLLINSCIARNQKTGAFYITGRSGLTPNPNELSNYLTGTMQAISSGEKRGEAIVEPQAVYQLPDGRLILSRECS